MNSAVTFALLSLVSAGCLDVSFKRFSRKSRSRGIYVAFCGIVWTALQLAYVSSQDIEIRLDAVTVGYGAAAGLVVAVANLLLIESLTHLNVSMGSTIYRLNTIGVIILSVLVLGEPLGALKVLGILCGIFAVWVLYEQPAAAVAVKGAVACFWLAVAASALRAIFGVTAKAGLTAGADANTMLLLYAVAWVPSGLAYAWWREGRVRITATKVAYGAVSGFLLYLTANFLIAAMAFGDVSVVAPIANLSFIVALLISAGMGMEQLTPRKGAAIAIAGVAIYLLAQSV